MAVFRPYGIATGWLGVHLRLTGGWPTRPTNARRTFRPLSPARHLMTASVAHVPLGARMPQGSRRK